MHNVGTIGFIIAFFCILWLGANIFYLKYKAKKSKRELDSMRSNSWNVSWKKII